MSFVSEPSTIPSLPSTTPYDPSQGDLVGPQQGLMPGRFNKAGVNVNQLHALGWMDCPKCHKFWLSPENKAILESKGNNYFTCPHCRTTTPLMVNEPWHGVIEPEHYPKGNTGGGTAIGLPMSDVGQIGENLVYQMKAIPGYGPIVWWHQGGATGMSALDGATSEWGIEVKTGVFDSGSHYWHPGDQTEASEKNQAAAQMGLQGILGILVMLNFKTDTADIWLKAMPLTPYRVPKAPIKQGVIKWHKRTGQLIAQNVPFTSPYKDPNNPAPGPYSMESYYQPPKPIMDPVSSPPEQTPF